ncbi:hypothetical protein FOZ62_027700, partial [Perkinsus olseni]
MLAPTPLPAKDTKNASRSLATTPLDSLASFKFLNFSWLDLQIAAQRRASCKFGGEGESYSSSQARSAAGHTPPAAASGLLTRTKSLPSASMLPSDDDGHRDAEHSAKYVRGYTGSFAGAWIN